MYIIYTFIYEEREKRERERERERERDNERENMPLTRLLKAVQWVSSSNIICRYIE